MQRLIIGLTGLVLGALFWWLLADRPRGVDVPDITTHVPSDAPTTTPPEPERVRPVKRDASRAPAQPPDTEAVLQIAKDACARDATAIAVKLRLPTGVPEIPGIHPAVAVCENGHLSLLSFARGEDDWITLESKPDGTELTICDFDDTEEMTGCRRWIDGRLVERSEITLTPDGLRDVVTYKHGKKVNRFAQREAVLSASSYAALEAHLDTQGLDDEDRALTRTRYFERSDYFLNESFQDDGSLASRRESMTKDLGDGWSLSQTINDLDGDGVVDFWLVERRHIGGRYSVVMVTDTDRDGRFETLSRRLGSQENAEVIAIDWPVEAVDLARMQALLLAIP